MLNTYSTSSERENQDSPIPYQQVFEFLPTSSLLLSPDFLIINVSQQFVNTFLIPRDKLIGTLIYEVFHFHSGAPETPLAENLKASLKQVLSTREPHELNQQPYDLPHLTGTGEYVTKYWNITHTPLLSKNGKVEYIIQNLIDVTENVKIKEQLSLSQAQEVKLRTELAHQRARFNNFLQEIPAEICVFSGPDFVYDYVNPRYQQQLFPGRELIGKPLLQAVPEMADQPILQVLRHVYQTGETSEGKEILIPLAPHEGAPLLDHYFNYIQQARFNEHGEVDGIMTFAYDITELVQARKLAEQREEALEVLNKDLADTNLELHTTNEALIQVQEDLQQLNSKLEERVAVRTQELNLAQADTERHWKRLESLFMQAPAPIVILSGPELVYELVNPAYQQIFPGRQLLGKPLLEALPEVKGTPIYDILKKVFDTGETFVAQEMPLMLARNTNGPLEEIYWTFTYQARRGVQGEIDGILVFAHEVTDQVKARKLIEANARQLKLVTDSLPVLIAYLDKEEKYQFANKAYEPWFNQPPEALLGRPVREIIGEKAYQGVKNYIERALAGERQDFEARMPYRENFVKYIRTSYIPDKQQGKVLGIYTLVSDITDQVKAREAIINSERQAKSLAEELARANANLLVANQQLKHTNVDLDNFIYTASHDLKSPILNIEGLLEVLRDYLSPVYLESEDIKQILDMIEGSVERFKQTITDLTEISRLQRSIGEISQVNLSDIVQEIVLDLRPQIEESQAKLLIDLKDCPTISFSAKNIRSIIYNLLSNAIKYRSPERTLIIKINCRVEENYWVLTVQDNGLGMTITEDTQLFTMFRRLHDHVEGSGIGLYMVKRIMDNANGKITVESKEGEGSTFTLYFKRN